MTPEEYLAFERECEWKHEYDDGVVYEMPGVNVNHVRIVGGLATELHRQPGERRYSVLLSPMKVRIQDSRKFLYPDVLVMNDDEVMFHDEQKDCILNPVVVIEVMSEGSEAYDRGEKFHAYQELESLNEYLLVSQDEPLVEHFVRTGARTWVYKPTAGLESSLTLPSVECTLNLSAVYKRVEF
ncbi:MAG TPA: Uma2 family endonuclease [Pyrinomonadaceae bacterium]|nr:Uma2 family endonuclease [Pyrinomonadaceae bacterium]